MKLIYCLIATCLLTNIALAQDTAAKKKGKYFISLGSDGVKAGREDSAKSKHDHEDKFNIHWGVLDLGINSLQDKTNYNTTAAQNFLHVDPAMKNSNLFNLNQSKSININIYPIMTQYRLLKTKSQKIYLVSGLGLQLYNFRFDKPITYVNNTNPAIIMDSVSFKKNKLAFDYLTIPMELLFKTRLGEKNWLVYGFGITGGYRLDSWTKQISSERGKQKNHDKFDFNDFNSCLTGEIGIDGYFRLYATYQITSLQQDGLKQYPFCIGIRFLGI